MYINTCTLRVYTWRSVKRKKNYTALKQQFYRDNDVASRYGISGIKLSEPIRSMKHSVSTAGGKKKKISTR